MCSMFTWIIEVQFHWYISMKWDVLYVVFIDDSWLVVTLKLGVHNTLCTDSFKYIIVFNYIVMNENCGYSVLLNMVHNM